MTELEIAKAIGRNVGLGKPLICPECSDEGAVEGEGVQLMSSIGDYENLLFCPHCDLRVDLVVKVKPYPPRKVKEARAG